MSLLEKLYLCKGRLYRDIDDEYVQSVDDVKILRSIFFMYKYYTINDTETLKIFEIEWNKYDLNRNYSEKGYNELVKFLERYSPYNMIIFINNVQLEIDMTFKFINIDFRNYYLEEEYKLYINEKIKSIYG